MAKRGAQLGNDNAKGSVFGQALRRAIAQEDGKRIRAAAEKLLDLAAEGVPWAVRELADRTDGKAYQSIQLSGDAENPIRVEDSTRPKLTKEEWLEIHGVGTSARSAK